MRHAALFFLMTAAVQLMAKESSKPIFQIRLVREAAAGDTEQMSYQSRDGQTLQFQVKKKPLLDQTAVVSASVASDTTGHPEVRVALTPKGRKRLAKITRQNIHNRIAVVIDGVLYDAPVIQAEISTDWLPVLDNFTEQQAAELAAKINAAVKKNPR